MRPRRRQREARNSGEATNVRAAVGPRDRARRCFAVPLHEIDPRGSRGRSLPREPASRIRQPDPKVVLDPRCATWIVFLQKEGRARRGAEPPAVHGGNLESEIEDVLASESQLL